MQHLCNAHTISQASTCRQRRINLWACQLEVFLKTLWNTDRQETREKNKPYLESLGNFHSMCSTLPHCLREWINQTNGWEQSWSATMCGGGGSTLWKMNCCLSNQNPTWWESSEVALCCDSALLVTSAEQVPLQLILRGTEPGKLIKGRGAGGAKTRSSLGKKRREGWEIRPWITASL